MGWAARIRKRWRLWLYGSLIAITVLVAGIALVSDAIESRDGRSAYRDMDVPGLLRQSDALKAYYGRIDSLSTRSFGGGPSEIRTEYWVRGERAEGKVRVVCTGVYEGDPPRFARMQVWAEVPLYTADDIGEETKP